MTIREMYEIAKAAKTPLLSNHPSAFWTEYRENFEKYDRAFMRLYSSFCYYCQDGTEEPAVSTADFTDAVLMHLMFNDKKYSELYRLHILDNMEILNSYNMSENTKTDASGTTDTKRGAETVKQTNTGKDTTTGSGTGETTTGSRHDYQTLVVGEQDTEDINKVSPYNADGEFQDETAKQSHTGTRLDNTTNDIGEQTNTSEATTTETTDTTATATTDRSDRSDTAATTATETKTVEAHGNIGNSTQANNAKAFKNFWNSYEFYSMIFGRIAKDLLLADYGLEV